MSLLQVNNLHTYFDTRRGTVKAVNGVTFSVEEGRTLGIVGESGSGKSQTAMSILKLFQNSRSLKSHWIGICYTRYSSETMCAAALFVSPAARLTIEVIFLVWEEE